MGNGKETPYGDPVKEAFLPQHHTSVCLLQGCRKSKPRMISCPLSLLLPSQGNQTSWECCSMNSKICRSSLKPVKDSEI